MINGSIKKIRWDSYSSPYLKIKSRTNNHDWNTCGSATLSLITGLAPGFIEKSLPKTVKHWSTLTMNKYLNSLGFTTITVSKNSIVNTEWTNYPLTPKHCLLLNVRCDLKENSWYVLHDNVLWHNLYRDENFNPMFFLNKPTQDVTLVWHPAWIIPPEPVIKPTSKRKKRVLSDEVAVGDHFFEVY